MAAPYGRWDNEKAASYAESHVQHQARGLSRRWQNQFV
jgi:hypothetical protein